jgi:cell division protein FtsW
MLGICALLATMLGLIVLSSVGIARADPERPYHFLGLQAATAAFSIGVMLPLVFFGVDYRKFRKRGWILLIALATLVALCLVLVPGIGKEVNGSYRWIPVGPINVQPSELAKIAFIYVLAAWYDPLGRRELRRFSNFLVVGVWTGCVAGTLLLEPDYGAAVLICVLFATLVLVAGTPPKFVLPFVAGGVVILSLLIWFDPVHRGRIVGFLYPEHYPAESYQQLQALASFRSGGLWGKGLWNSLQEYGHLPEAHTDSIIAIAAEELGLVATLGVVLLFCGILFCGMRIALAATDKFGRLMAVGLTVMLVAQAGVNLGVNTMCLPNKGMALPFISYGGTSLVASWFAVAILLNIGRQAMLEADVPDEEAPPSLYRNTLQSL